MSNIMLFQRQQPLWIHYAPCKEKANKYRWNRKKITQEYKDLAGSSVWKSAKKDPDIAIISLISYNKIVQMRKKLHKTGVPATICTQMRKRHIRY